jgi:hypothetical protein
MLHFDDTLERLPKPSVVSKANVGGIDFNKERMRWAGQAVLALAASTGCFTVSLLLVWPSKFVQQPAKPLPNTVRVMLPTISKNCVQRTWSNASAVLGAMKQPHPG